MLQLAFASQHISEDDDEWQGLLHLAPISEPPLFPLNMYYRRRVDTCPSVTHLSFCPFLRLHATLPPCLWTHRPVATSVTASHHHSQCPFSLFQRQTETQHSEIKRDITCQSPISTFQYCKIVFFIRLFTNVFAKLLQIPLTIEQLGKALSRCWSSQDFICMVSCSPKN